MYVLRPQLMGGLVGEISICWWKLWQLTVIACLILATRAPASAAAAAWPVYSFIQRRRQQSSLTMLHVLWILSFGLTVPIFSCHGPSSSSSSSSLLRSSFKQKHKVFYLHRPGEISIWQVASFHVPDYFLQFIFHKRHTCLSTLGEREKDCPPDVKYCELRSQNL